MFVRQNMTYQFSEHVKKIKRYKSINFWHVLKIGLSYSDVQTRYLWNVLTCVTVLCTWQSQHVQCFNANGIKLCCLSVHVHHTWHMTSHKHSISTQQTTVLVLSSLQHVCCITFCMLQSSVHESTQIVCIWERLYIAHSTITRMFGVFSSIEGSAKVSSTNKTFCGNYSCIVEC